MWAVKICRCRSEVDRSFLPKELQLCEKPSMLLMPSWQLIAGEVLRTTPESSLCISAVITNLLEGEMVGINWYSTVQ